MNKKIPENCCDIPNCFKVCSHGSIFCKDHKDVGAYLSNPNKEVELFFVKGPSREFIVKSRGDSINIEVTVTGKKNIIIDLDREQAESMADQIQRFLKYGK